MANLKKIKHHHLTIEEEELVIMIHSNLKTLSMDNALYHSQRKDIILTSNARKGDMINWLQSKNIKFPNDSIKVELYKIIKENKEKYIIYEIDEMTKQGHSILRLPSYHCVFNAIELIWAQVKNYVAKHNFDQKLNDVIQLFKEGCNHVTSQNWKDAIEHCRKEEENYWKIDNLMDNLNYN